MIVPPEGNLTRRIMFIGEAPAAYELREGRPFVGAAGHEQDRLNLQAGINRDDARWTNVIKERAPHDDISAFINLSKKPDYDEFCNWVSGKTEVVPRGVAPETRRHVAELFDEVDNFKGNVIVPLGNVPLWCLTGLTGIRKWRGSILFARGHKIVPCVHPSGILRTHSAIERRLAILDLIRVREESLTPVYNPPKRNLRIYPTFDDAVSYLRECQDEKMVGFDIETTTLGGGMPQLSCFAVAKSRSDCMSIPILRGGRRAWTEIEEVEILSELAALLESKSVTKVGQNIIFDTTFMYRRYRILCAPVEDTMIAQAIRYPDLPKGLDTLTRLYTREPYYKDDGKEWNLRTLTRSEREADFFRYNATDACIVLEIFPILKNLLIQQGNLETYEVHRDLIYPLLWMQERGIRIDTAALQKAKDAVAKSLKEVLADIKREANLNPNSPRQMMDFFYGQLNVKPFLNRASGRATINAEALRRLAVGTQTRKPIEIAGKILEYKKLVKLHGTYLSVKLGSDGRLRSALNPVGTRSGRISSSKDIFGEGLNIQTLPPLMKSFIIADDGYLLYSLDKAQAENRIVAYIAPEHNMMDAFEQGVDIHSQTASLIYKKPVSEISREVGTSKTSPYRSERDDGKQANHALNYKEGVDTLAARMEISRIEAQKIYDAYHTGYPGVRNYWNWVLAKLKKDGTLTNLFGRRYQFLERIDESTLSDALYFIPQSTVADLINRRGVLAIWNDPSLSEVELLNQIHDAIVFQVPIKLGVDRHFEILTTILARLDEPLTWGERKFIIPTDVTVGRGLKDSIVLKGKFTKEQFAEAFHKFA